MHEKFIELEKHDELSCLDVVRQPEEEHVADKLGAEQTEGELDHPGDEEGAEQTDGLLTLLLDDGRLDALGRGGDVEADMTRLGDEEEKHDKAGAGDD